MTYFDGSTTEIEPSSTIEIVRLDSPPGGGKTISIRQEAGLTWNRVEKLFDANSRFETTTAAGVVFVRGTEYKVRVEPDGTMIVEAVTDTVIVETVVNGQTVQVVLGPGTQTTVRAGQPPSPPVPIAPAQFSLSIAFDGPVAPFLTDDRNRSIGFHPQGNSYVSQIPGATYRAGAGRQILSVPDPTPSYRLIIKGEDDGPFAFTVRLLANGQPTAMRAAGLARSLNAEVTLSGTIRNGQSLQTDLQVSLRPPSITASNMTSLDGSPSGRVRITQPQVGTSAQELVTGGVLVQVCHFTGNAAAPFQLFTLSLANAVNHQGHPQDVPAVNGVCPRLGLTPSAIPAVTPIAAPSAAPTATAPPDAETPDDGDSSSGSIAPTPIPTAIPIPGQPSVVPVPPTPSTGVSAPTQPEIAPATSPPTEETQQPDATGQVVPDAPTAIPPTTESASPIDAPLPPTPDASPAPAATELPTSPDPSGPTPTRPPTIAVPTTVPTAGPTSTPTPLPPATASVSPTSGPPGTTFNVTGSRFAPGEPVQAVITYPNGGNQVALTADPNGNVRTAVQVQLTDSPGAYTVRFTGSTSGQQASASFTVVPAPASPTTVPPTATATAAPTATRTPTPFTIL
ncbi:MAG: hypothetical protein HW416_1080 [Chloroflexi bacterium]|nr:hypothetical protein [Chloroflexota bacterium]